MNYQVITTDMDAISNLKFGGNEPKRPKLSEELRKEREKLFNNPKTLKINRVSNFDKVKYSLGVRHTIKLGRKMPLEFWGLPKYGAVERFKFMSVKPKGHNEYIDTKISNLITHFVQKFDIGEDILRKGDKRYSITRVRTIIMGMLYAHYEMDGADLTRNFTVNHRYLWREQYRQMKNLLQFERFALPVSEIYSKLHSEFGYDFQNGKHVSLHR